MILRILTYLQSRTFRTPGPSRGNRHRHGASCAAAARACPGSDPPDGRRPCGSGCSRGGRILRPGPSGPGIRAPVRRRCVRTGRCPGRLPLFVEIIVNVFLSFFPRDIQIFTQIKSPHSVNHSEVYGFCIVSLNRCDVIDIYSHNSGCRRFVNVFSFIK